MLHVYDDFEEEDYDYRPIVVDGNNQLDQVFNEYTLLVSQELYPDLDIGPAMLCLMVSGTIKPEKYDGKPDLPEFDHWFQGVIGWMQLVRHCGGPITHNDEGDPIPSSGD